MHSIKESVIQSFIHENYPTARLVSWDDADSDLVFYNADQLREVDHDWFPLCCQKREESGQVIYGGRSGVVHTYTEGETGAGKTTRFAMQSIRALSCLKNKPSFLIVDIHGELTENLYTHLHENGYEIKILNCDDPSHSDTYNPFSPLVKRCLESGRLDNEVVKGIRKIAEIMQPVISDDDPIWEQGARSYTNGCILDKFEDLLRGNIPPQCITLYNIIENHYWLRDQIMGPLGNLKLIPHYKEKGTDALSVQKIMSVTNNAEKTRASYFGVIENHYDTFGQPSLYQLSSSSTIDIDRFMDYPTAIFIQSGSTSIGDDLIALLVNEIYTTAVIRGKNTAKKILPRQIHCFLDEFANINLADGSEFIKMLTTSRKFGLHWHLLVQCDAQLDSKYDANIARIIRANCTEIFMGSNEYETMVRFAKSCGQKTVEALGSMVSQETPMLETVDLISADKLNLTEHGHVYIKSNRHPLLHSYIEAFYHCPEFVSVGDILSVYPSNTFNYRKTAFFPDDILPPLSALDCRILLHLYEKGSEDIFTLLNEFTDTDASNALENLIANELIEENKQDERVLSLISPVQRELLVFRLKSRGNDTSATKNSPRQMHPSLKKMIPSDILTNVNHTKEVIKQLTCLHDDLKKILYKHCDGMPFSDEEKQTLISPTLRYLLVEAFIQNNNYVNKDSWTSGFQKEYEIATSIPQLPEQFSSAFTQALRELDELTLDNIKEIKKILS